MGEPTAMGKLFSSILQERIIIADNNVHVGKYYGKFSAKLNILRDIIAT